MARMLPPPKGVRGQRHQPAKVADNVVGTLRSEERAMATIMLDDEDPHEKPSGEHRQWQNHPRRYCETEVHRGASGKKPAERCRQLREAAPQDRVLKLRNVGKNVL